MKMEGAGAGAGANGRGWPDFACDLLDFARQETTLFLLTLLGVVAIMVLAVYLVVLMLPKATGELAKVYREKRQEVQSSFLPADHGG